MIDQPLEPSTGGGLSHEEDDITKGLEALKVTEEHGLKDTKTEAAAADGES